MIKRTLFANTNEIYHPFKSYTEEKIIKSFESDYIIEDLFKISDYLLSENVISFTLTDKVIGDEMYIETLYYSKKIGKNIIIDERTVIKFKDIDEFISIIERIEKDVETFIEKFNL